MHQQGNNMNIKDEMLSIILTLNKRKRHSVPKYARPTILGLFGGVCAYCGDVINAEKKNAWGVTHAIPVALGGEVSMDNWIPSCIPCIQKFGNSDCLSALTTNTTRMDPTWQSKLERIRDKGLLRSRNHLTHLSPKTDMEHVQKAIAARWTQERCTVFVTVLPTHVVLALTARSGSPQRVGEMSSLLLFGFKAQRSDVTGPYAATATKAGLNLFVVPRSRLIDVTMALTEENCWLREVRVSITPNHEDRSVWRSFWFRSYVTLKSNWTRRVYGEVQAPWYVRNSLSMTPGAVRRRRHYLKKKASVLEGLQYDSHVRDLRVAAGQPVENWDDRVKRLEHELNLQIKLS